MVPPQTFTSVAQASFQLALGLLAFALLGTLAARRWPQLWFERQPARIAHRILLGQLLLVGWLMARSLVNAVLGHVVPLGLWDVALLGVLLGVAGRRGPPLRSLVSAPTLVVLGTLVLAMARVSWLELPRLVMLSTDPDQHAFMAHQVLRLGTVPYFSQSDWGTTGFGYPEGFATLNAAWMLVTRLDARDVVQVQGALQCLLGSLALLETVLDTRSPLRAGAAAVLVVGLYFVLLPYGYQTAVYYSEATGRTSAVGELALLLSCLVATVAGRATAVADLFVCGAVLCFVEVLNISLLPSTGLLALVVVAWHARATGPWRRSALRGASILLGGAGLGLLAPWFLVRLLGLETGRHLEHLGRPAAVGLTDALRAVFTDPELWASLLSPGPLSWQQGALWLLGAGGGLALVARSRPTLRAGLFAALGVLGVMALLLAPTTVLASVAASKLASGYLLLNYLEAARTQLTWLVMTLLGALLSAAVVEGGRGALFAALPLVVAFALEPFRGDLHRQRNPGALDGATADDLLVLRDAEALWAQWSHRPNPPLILVANVTVTLKGESWLFPVGASRILPLADTFPSAFFYFQGSADYTWDNYLAHVCHTLDREWLAARRIRYLFLPELRKGACVTFNPEDWVAVSTHGASALYELRGLDSGLR